MIVLGKKFSRFLLFVLLNNIFIEIVLIITAIDRYGLYCSSVSLLETLENPTPFCKFSGKTQSRATIKCITHIQEWYFNTIF